MVALALAIILYSRKEQVQKDISLQELCWKSHSLTFAYILLDIHFKRSVGKVVLSEHLGIPNNMEIPLARKKGQVDTGQVAKYIYCYLTITKRLKLYMNN